MKYLTTIILSLLAAALLISVSETHPVVHPARLEERKAQYSGGGSGGGSSGGGSSGGGSSGGGSSGGGSSSSGSSGSSSSSSGSSSSSSSSGSSGSSSSSSSSGSSGSSSSSSGSSSSSSSSGSSGSSSSSSGSSSSSSSSGSSGSSSSSSGSSSSSSSSGSSGSSSNPSSSSSYASYPFSGSNSASYDGGNVPQPEPSDIAYNVASSASDEDTCTPGVPQQANQATQDLMKGYETFQPSPYDDGYGGITVGYGHLCSDSTCSGTGYTYPMTEAQASTLFSQDIEQYETCVTNAVRVPLNANQYGALVSWTFNAGCGNAAQHTGMAGSTLIQELNAGLDPNTVAAEQLPRWDHAGGQVSPGLQNRRAAEVNLFQTPSSDQGTCPSGD